MKTSATLPLTLAAMTAFAANSLFCRMALGSGEVDAASFTAIRVISGALTLALVMLPRWRKGKRGSSDWRAATMLFVYMVFFSFAYLTLSAGTGALLLFAAVQMTMIAAALRAREPFSAQAWLGLAVALSGLVVLLLPGLSAPDPWGAGLMVVAGVAWGFYSLLGRHVADPLEATTSNFILCVPLVIIVSGLFVGDYHLTTRGALLAVASGALASGLGYVTWYAALRGLAANHAATVQLSVPVIAALGGVIFLSEPVTTRLLIASAATLGGIALVLAQKSRIKEA